MQLNLTGHHVDITPALRDYVTSKLERVERHIDSVTNAHVILSVEKLRQKAEARIHITGHEVYADAEDGDMYAAIDALVDKLDRQIKKHKEKSSEHRRDSSLKDMAE